MHNMTSLDIMRKYGITENMREKMGCFLECYIDVVDESPFSDSVVIRQGFKELINNGIFTEKQMQKEILRESCVFLPLDFIRACAR